MPREYSICIQYVQHDSRRDGWIALYYFEKLYFPLFAEFFSGLHTVPFPVLSTSTMKFINIATFLFAGARTCSAITAADIEGGVDQAVALKGEIEGTVAAANWICWTTGTATTAAVDATCAAVGTCTHCDTAALTTATCAAAGKFDFHWNPVTQTSLSFIECSDATTAVGSAVAVTITKHLLNAGPKQTLALEGEIEGTLATATNYACWTTGTATTAATPATCAAAGTTSGHQDSGSVLTPTCLPVGTSAAFDLHWSATTHTSLSFIECSDATTAVGAASPLTVTLAKASSAASVSAAGVATALGAVALATLA